MNYLDEIKNLLYNGRATNKGETLGMVIEDSFNGELSTNDKEHLATYLTRRAHRYLQSEIFKFCLKLIKTYADMPDYCFDGRNEWVHKRAKAICNTANEDGYNVFEWETPYKVAE